MHNTGVMMFHKSAKGREEQKDCASSLLPLDLVLREKSAAFVMIRMQGSSFEGMFVLIISTREDVNEVQIADLSIASLRKEMNLRGADLMGKYSLTYYLFILLLMYCRQIISCLAVNVIILLFLCYTVANDPLLVTDSSKHSYF